jgi:hypothetical protein
LHQHCFPAGTRYLNAVSHLTKQEQFVLCVVIGLLLTGWGVKAYRQAHPPIVAVEPVKH